MNTYTEKFIKNLLDPDRDNRITSRIAEDTFGFTVPAINQNNQSHTHDLLTHSLAVVDNLPRRLDSLVYLAGFLHDVGKPDCMTTDEFSGYSHFFKHPARSAEIIREHELDMGLTNSELNELLFYVEFHDVTINRRMHPMRQLIRKGADWRMFCNLMRLQIADAQDHVYTEHTVERISNCVWAMSEAGKALFDEVMSEEITKELS